MTISTTTMAKYTFYLVMSDIDSNKNISKKFIVTIDCVTYCDCSSVVLVPVKQVQEFY